MPAINFARLKLRHLQCLVVVAQERNLVRAARALALTQPAVSKTIAELEDIVGRRLLLRRRRGVELTPAADVLVRHAVVALRGLREGLGLALDQPELDQLHVAVGALPNMAAHLLPAAIAALHAKAPALRVRVVSGTNAQLMTQLRQGEIDLVLGRLAQASAMADLAFEHLYSEPLLLVARPGHSLASLRHPELDALAAYPLVVPVSGTLIRHTADAFLVARGLAPPRCLVEATDTSFAVGLLQCSDAVWFAPQGAVDGFLARGELRRLAIDTASTEGPVGLTVRRGSEQGEGARLLIESIHEVVLQRAQVLAAAARPGRARRSAPTG
ncbi:MULTISPECIES: LysR substrate-binding domain-containing protein [unclassified Variovorax]|uniref:LysR substrate-binding domain-containing protein n=1 Tax=unclassified Variovorax TaxID=663243 RepID=UPI0008395F72|nr:MULTISPECIES: LysR substrate-binding domain-containing protein [unclassified Variovorax]PNG51958.1 HTH-type transcriptional regulator GbpR [Variovorax sp. B4]PNG54498.1 HTH-type transcriptional regulator GbpR [Variovorax sp. B2]VTV15460.1 Galactose-binding protein regulator [Variovorax sp. WDL1]